MSMILKAVVDRVEGEWAVIIPESGKPFNIPLSSFPNLKEGNHIVIDIYMDLVDEQTAQADIAKIRSGLNRTPL